MDNSGNNPSIKVNEMNKVCWLEHLSTSPVRFHNTIASNFIDPGNLNVSFQLLKKFPLLFVGGYHPLLLNSIAQAPNGPIFQRKQNFKSMSSSTSILARIKEEDEAKSDLDTNIIINLSESMATPSRGAEDSFEMQTTAKQSVSESPSYDVEFKNDCIYQKLIYGTCQSHFTAF